jgi:hypothetical protein
MPYKNLTPERLAKILKRSAQIKEESFDHKAADKAEKKRNYVEYKQFYKINLEQSVEQAVKEFKIDPRFSNYIYLSFHWWNDILDWADSVSIKTNGKED